MKKLCLTLILVALSGAFGCGPEAVGQSSGSNDGGHYIDYGNVPPGQPCGLPDGGISTAFGCR